jgi:hypothetical protein
MTERSRVSANRPYAHRLNHLSRSKQIKIQFGLGLHYAIDPCFVLLFALFFLRFADPPPSVFLSRFVGKEVREGEGQGGLTTRKAATEDEEPGEPPEEDPVGGRGGVLKTVLVPGVDSCTEVL